MIFPNKQVSQFYAVKAVKNNTDALANVGDIALMQNVDGAMWFTYVGVDGKPQSSPIINSKNIVSASFKPARGHALQESTITLNDEVNGGNPVENAFYIVRLQYHPYLMKSPENVVSAYGEVLATPDMTASVFYAKLAMSLAKNVDPSKITITLVGGDDPVLPTTKLADLTGTYTGVIATEVEQPWVRGKKEIVPIDLVGTSDVILYNTVEVMGLTVENGVTEEYTSGGKLVADLEFYAMGNRADMYRQVGYPDNFDTEYLIDPEEEYNLFTINHFFTGCDTNVAKSKQTIILAMPASTDASAIIQKLTAAGITVAQEAG